MDVKKAALAIAAAMAVCSVAVININKKNSAAQTVPAVPAAETKVNRISDGYNSVVPSVTAVSVTAPPETAVQTSVQTSASAETESEPEAEPVTEITETAEPEVQQEADAEPESVQTGPEPVPTVQGPVVGECLYDIVFVEYGLPENPAYTGFKAYEPYTSITSKTSRQWQLQQDAITDIKGFRMLDGRYMVALGTYFDAPCGTYVDIILENGVLIPCIVGDIKSDAHTDEETHAFSKCMCATEFIVDEKYSPVRDSGNVSYVYDEWNSKVKCIWVYWKTY